jgi:hypothetical protein
MGASLRKGLAYHRASSFQIRQNVIIPEAQHSEANTLYVPVSTPILLAVMMLASVDFDSDARFQASEVRDVRSQGMLTAEPMAVQPTCFQNLPKLPLGKGHFPAQLARPVALGGLAHSHSLRKNPMPQCRDIR